MKRYGALNGDLKRYVSVKKNKDKETRMELVSGGWMCPTRKKLGIEAEIDVCVPCDPAIESFIEGFADDPMRVRGTQYLQEITGEATGSRASDTAFSVAFLEAGVQLVDTDPEAAAKFIKRGTVKTEVSTPLEFRRHENTKKKPRKFFECTAPHWPVLASASGREGPVGELNTLDVVECISITKGANGLDRLRFEGGYVDLQDDSNSALGSDL